MFITDAIGSKLKFQFFIDLKEVISQEVFIFIWLSK